jgi:two-component system, NarL family, response regulator NreC
MRVLLADDHKMMRDGLRAIIAKEEGFDVVGEAANGHEAVTLARRLKPQVVIMDISMPELNGVDATRQLLLDLPGIKVIALSMNADRRYVLAMFRAGAVGYLLKNSASEELIQALRAVTDDLTYVSPSIAAVVVDNYVSSTSEISADKPLSPRERELLQLLAEGKSSKDIASRLNLALPTVESHRRQIMDKLGLRTIAELTKYAIREGITSLD